MAPIQANGSMFFYEKVITPVLCYLQKSTVDIVISKVIEEDGSNDEAVTKAKNIAEEALEKAKNIAATAVENAADTAVERSLEKNDDYYECNNSLST